MDGSSMGRGRPHLPQSGGLVPSEAYPTAGIQSFHTHRLHLNRLETDSLNRLETDSRTYPAVHTDTGISFMPVAVSLSQSCSGTSTSEQVDNGDSR